MTLVVNLYGGPGTGKSTLAAQLFANLKLAAYECELVTEYAKKLVWQGATEILNDQIYVFGKQQHMLSVLNDQVDVIITDSPILMSIIYGKNFGTECQRDALDELTIRTHATYDNLDIFLRRTKPYVGSGRLQTFEEAKIIDAEILSLLNSNLHEFEDIPATSGAALRLLGFVTRRLKYES